MKKILIIAAASIPFLGIAASVGATSTVILDPPDISEMVGYAYDAAQPLWNSIAPWVGIVLGFIFLGWAVSKVLGAFHH